MGQKAVVILYSPKTICDFIWYYCTYGKEYDWTAICIPYGFSHNDIAFKLCKRAGVFEKIIFDKDDTSYWSMAKKSVLMMKMFAFFLFGKREEFCQNFVNNKFNLNEYSLVVVPSDYMTVSGYLIALSKQRKTVILEDGAADYLERKKKLEFSEMKTVWEIAGILFSKMNYGNIGMKYWFEDTKYCDKFASNPELMKYKNYASISKLNDFKYTDKVLYDECLNKIFEIEPGIKDVEVMLLTTVMDDFVNDSTNANKKTIDYMVKKFPNKKILIKKHPRDTNSYLFPKEVSYIEVDKEIPSEILLKVSNIKKIVFTFPSTTLLFLDKEIQNFEVLYYEDIEKENSKIHDKHNYKRNFNDVIKSLEIEEKNIVRL